MTVSAVLDRGLRGSPYGVRKFPKLFEVDLTLVNFQLDAQNSYLFIYNTFIRILYMFRPLPCSSSGGLRRNCIYAASGVVTLQVAVLCTG